jgi:hypothetical protein
MSLCGSQCWYSGTPEGGGSWRLPKNNFPGGPGGRFLGFFLKRRWMMTEMRENERRRILRLAMITVELGRCFARRRRSS